MAEEACTTLIAIARNAVTAYQGESLWLGDSGTGPGPISIHRVCPSASRPVPADASMVSGKTYQPTRADWAVDRQGSTDVGHADGFACLRWAPSAPQHYQYDYQATRTGFVARARGDLDGNGVFSTFELRGELVDGRLVAAETISEVDPGE